MYITYCRNQRALNVVDPTQHRLNATSGDFRPRYLIRVSDWKKVSGKEAINGYCALSYCWKQSGEIIHQGNGKYECIDKGKHCIVDGYDIGDNGFITKIKRFLMINDEKDSVNMVSTEEADDESIPQFTPSANTKATIRHVTFEELIQQLCKDFQIEYLWVDKLCIDQADSNTKQEEIKRMHRIYGDASYTVAIVPEIHVHDPEDFDIIDPLSDDTQANVNASADRAKSLWWKRSWTLEETMVSKRILVVGTDTHLWQHSFYTCNIPTTVDAFSVRLLDFANQPQGGGSVNQALREAHFRTSSWEHDKIFSLANIFHEMFKNMKISYKTDVKTIFDQFYQTVATNDLSILCFGSNLELDGSERRANTMRNHQLPSWTGVNGAHIFQRVTTTTSWLHSPHIICNNMLLHISTKYYKTLSIIPYALGCFSSLSDDKQQANTYRRRRESTRPYMIQVEEDTALIDWSIKLHAILRCHATHYYQPLNLSIMQARPLSLTEDCEECIILPILLKSDTLSVKEVQKSPTLVLHDGFTHLYYLPVFKKYRTGTNITEEQYKAIGIYVLGNVEDLNLDSDDPDTILSTVFDRNAAQNEVKEFIIQ
ncbi:heterokaryon incompatibility protein-domain-containing protein [Phascolomyces articulosus]|uniref:Heterokaryon incompatibility protein-domain-containing protein n=1 Tax=Phascolomyces articulosus TaxID=60185 RepID=A0AAD5KED4_9FUNG|nr:heterokaryon incompatibility protein-domain-containing protein [Phascolomyces articulosus]